MAVDTATKATLAAALAQETGLTKTEAAKAITGLFDPERGLIARCLAHGMQVKLTGFGSFVRKDMAARQGRNPKTGETIQISARSKVAFRVGKALKEVVLDSAPKKKRR